MSGDFGGLRGIVEEARALDDEVKNRPLVACPLCGTPLQRNTEGIANCPFGDFRTTAQTEGEVYDSY